MQETTEHPTAEMVYQWLKPTMPRLSLGTVYRNLHQMAEVGRLVEIPGPVARFDAVTQPHTHFSCTECGSVSDLPMAYDAALDLTVQSRGYEVRDHRLIFYGICPTCVEKIETEQT